MKNVITILVVMGMLGSACDDEGEQRGFTEGSYMGHFQRTTPTGDWMVSNVTLELTDHSFSGESDHARYPAICNGTYTTERDNITFENKCVWTADFDWTFILDGTFEIETDGNQLTLTKRYNEHEYDTYSLTRK